MPAAAMQPSSTAQSRREAAANHRKRPIAKRPWHKSVLLCCFAGVNKEEDVDDPMEPAAVPAGDSANIGTTRASPNPTAVNSNSAAPRPATSVAPVDVPPLKAEGPTTNLLDDAVTDHSIPLFEGNSGTADARVAARDLNLGSPLISPSTSHVALASTAAAAEGLRSCHEVSSAEDLVPDSSSSNSRIGGPAVSRNARSAGSPVPQQQQQHKGDSPFINQQHQSNVTAELLGMQMQMQQYLVQHPEAEQSYQQQRASLEEQRRSKAHHQQQQRSSQGAQHLAPAGSPAGTADAAFGSNAGDGPLPALFSRNVAGWDSDRSAAAAGAGGAAAAAADVNSNAVAAAGSGSSSNLAAVPDSNFSSLGAPAAAALAADPRVEQVQQQQNAYSRQRTDINRSRDQEVKQAPAGMPPRSPKLPKMLSDTGSGGSSSGNALPAAWYARNSSSASTPAVINYTVGVNNQNPDVFRGEVQGLGDSQSRLKPLSLLKSEQSDDSSPFQQQQQGYDQSYSVVPITAGMPPLSPIRIPSSNSNNNLLKLIGHSGALDPDLDDSPQSPRMSVVGVSNSVINNLLSEEGIPLVPTEPGLAESLMDPVPETLELTPETPKRVRSFVSAGGNSGNRRQWGSVPSTPRVSASGTSGVLPGGPSGDATSLGGTWSGTAGDQAGGDSTSPLRAGQVVRGYRGQRQLVSGARGGIVSDSNVVKGYSGYEPAAYRRSSNAAAGSNRHGNEVSSWDDAGVSGLRSGSSSSSRNYNSSRARRGSSGFEAATPRASRGSLPFSEMQRSQFGSTSNRFSSSVPRAPAEAAGDFILLDADSASDSATQPSAVANADADVSVTDLPGSDLDMFAADDNDLGMSAAHIAAAASFSMSPPDDPNPSHANNIIDWFEPTTTSMTPRGSQSRRYSVAEPRDFGPESFSGGGSSSSGQVFESDRGFGSSVATSNMLGSGALFSRSGMADLAKSNRGVGHGNQGGVYAGVSGSPGLNHQGIAGPASLFATPVQHPIPKQAK